MSTTTGAEITEPISDRAWEAIRGAYDLQVHVAPDVIERRTDDVDLAKDFLSHGLKGFVLKSHYIPTAERAKVVRRAVLLHDDDDVLEGRGRRNRRAEPKRGKRHEKHLM